MTQSADDEWSSLDRAARANLRDADLAAFFRRKDELKAGGSIWDGDAEAVLTGWIRDAIEGYE